MKTVTKINKNTNVWVSDRNGDPVPGIEFYFTITYRGVTETICIYYNCVDGPWFGINIGYEEPFDLDDAVVNSYVNKFNLKARIHDDH